MEEKQKQPTTEQKIKGLQSWIPPKEVQIHAIKNSIEIQELKIKQIEINVKEGWFVKDKDKQIREARNDYERKVKEHERALLGVELENSLVGGLDRINLEDLKTQLLIEENSLINLISLSLSSLSFIFNSHIFKSATYF